jgi:YggT family protein
MLSNIAHWLASLINLYTMILFVRIILTWVPSIDWYKQPFQVLKAITDPPLNLARSVIPPIGMLDLSPIVVFLVLSLLRGLLLSL